MVNKNKPRVPSQITKDKKKSKKVTSTPIIRKKSSQRTHTAYNKPGSFVLLNKPNNKRKELQQKVTPGNNSLPPNDVSEDTHAISKQLETVLDYNKQLELSIQQLREEVKNAKQGAESYSSSNQSNADLLRMINETLINRQNPIAANALSPCTSIEGGEIQLTDWECWKRRFDAWLKASNIACPSTQQMYFDVYAGDKLSIALITAPIINEPNLSGYELTVKRLDTVFRRRTSSFAVKKDFLSMRQKANETNVAYLSRLMTAALTIWDRTDPKIDEEIMLSMVINSNNDKMKEFALRINSEGSADDKKYENLVNQARLADNIIELKGATDSRMLAVSDHSYVPRPLFNESGRSGGNRSDWDRTRNSDRGFVNKRGNANYRNKDSSSGSYECFRCGEMGHIPSSCESLSKGCNYCKIKGHAALVCRRRQRERATGESSRSGHVDKKPRLGSVNNVNEAEPEQKGNDKPEVNG